MSPHASRLTIGELARSAGVGVETIRYYEREGLLDRPARPSRGYRTYPADAVERLTFIRSAKALGFSLTDVAELLRLRARKAAPCASVKTRALAKLAEIDARIAQLRALRAALAALADRCHGDRAVESCSILALLSEPTVHPFQGASHVPDQPRIVRPRAPRLRRSV